MTPEQTQQVLPVLVHIQTHIEEELSLESLAATAALSPHHFHRLFKAAVGETARVYVERLRMERAAFLLRFTAEGVTAVSLAVGYQSHEVFSRAFRRHYAQTPSGFRSAANSSATTRFGSRHPSGQLPVPKSLSSVQVLTLEPLHLAFIRNVGPYEAVDVGLFDELQQWLVRHSISGEHMLCGLGHDTPGLTAANKLRFDVCATVAGSFKGHGKVAYQQLAARTVAAITFVGPL